MREELLAQNLLWFAWNEGRPGCWKQRLEITDKTIEKKKHCSPLALMAAQMAGLSVYFHRNQLFWMAAPASSAIERLQATPGRGTNNHRIKHSAVDGTVETDLHHEQPAAIKRSVVHEWRHAGTPTHSHTNTIANPTTLAPDRS